MSISQKLSFKFADFILSALSLYHVMLGLGSIFLYFSTESIAGNLLTSPTIVGLMLGVTPYFVVDLVTVGSGGIFSTPVVVSNSHLLLLGISALILGILSMVALIRMKYNIKWLRVWYALVLLSFAFVIINISYFGISTFSRAIAAPFLFSLIFAGVVYYVRTQAEAVFASQTQI